MKPWVEKYRPKYLSEIVGNSNAIKVVESWVKKWKSGIPEKRAILLHGPPGVGKTTVAYAIANELGYDKIELNASDYRTYRIIKRIVGSASVSGTLDPSVKGKIIILDEVDGIHARKDIGGLSAIKSLINITLQPIVLIANDPWSLPKDFRDMTLMVEFKRLSQTDIIKVLKRICAKEKLHCDERALKVIASNANGDLRAAINDLQAIAERTRRVSLEDTRILAPRDAEIKIFETILRIMKTEYCYRAREAIMNTDEEPDVIMAWIAENLPKEYEDPYELALAYNYLSRADVFLGRIYRRQDWVYLAYATTLMGCGVALAKKRKYRKFVKYSYPKIFIELAKTKQSREIEKSIAEKLQIKKNGIYGIHGSKRMIRREIIPLLKSIMRADIEEAAKIVKKFSLSKEEVKYLVEDEGTAEKIIAESKKIKLREEKEEPRPLLLKETEGAEKKEAEAEASEKPSEEVKKEKEEKKRKKRKRKKKIKEDKGQQTLLGF